MTEKVARRPLKSRQTKWANKIAARLIKAKVSPNYISIASVIFALLAAVVIVDAGQTFSTTKIVLYIAGAAFIQLRLLCNLFDGMVAVEGNMQSPTGEIFNDLPDRIADLFIIVSLGYSIKNINYAIELAWLGGALSVFVAYVRLLGGACGLKQKITGPMTVSDKPVT